MANNDAKSCLNFIDQQSGSDNTHYYVKNHESQSRNIMSPWFVATRELI